MKNIRHPSNNTTVEPPKNWERKHGAKLPLRPLMATGGTTDGVNVLVTWWEPTPDELAVLLRGGKIQLACIGGMPGVKLEVVEEIGAPAVMVAH